MHEHVFADESKVAGFLLAAVFVQPADLARLRSEVGALRLPGQRRLHFTRESDGRRKQIIRTFAGAGVSALVYDATRFTNGKEARDAAVGQLAEDAAAMGAERLVLELDDSVARNDRRVIFQRLAKLENHDALRYVHMRAREECLLALPDAVAWSWARGGRWRRLVEGMVTNEVRL